MASVEGWGKAIGATVGAATCGPAGAAVGSVAGGLLESVLPSVTDAVGTVAGNIAGNLGATGVQWLGGRAYQRLRSQPTIVNHDLQHAFRQAALQALHDIGGKACFADATFKPDRPIPDAIRFPCAPDEVACDRLQQIEALIRDEHRLPLEAEQDAANVETYLTAESIEDLNGTFVAHLLAPDDALFRSVRALPELERHLRRHLLDRTLVHLGDTLKENTEAWRAFNRLMLDTLLAELRDMAKAQQQILELLDTLQPKLTGDAFVADLSATLATLLQTTGEMRKEMHEGFRAVLRRVTAQHRALIQHLNGQHSAVMDALTSLRHDLQNLLNAQHGAVMGTLGDLQRNIADVQVSANKILEAAQTRTATGAHPTFNAAVPDFVGREHEIDELTQALHTAQDGSTPICGIFGMSGLGKTELARKAADETQHIFPGGRLLLELRGTTDPMTPQEALTACITEFGGKPEQQQTVDELRRLYLRTLNGKRALIIADNVRDKTHVDYLTPPPGCALVVTSQEAFTVPGMLLRIQLPELQADQAEQLLLTICTRIGAAAPALARECRYLPLALQVSATLLADDPTLEVDEHVQALANARTRLSALEDPNYSDNPKYSVKAALLISYNALDAEAQAIVRRLGIFVTSFGLPAAEAVVTPLEDLGVPLKRLLSRLVQRNMLRYDPTTTRYSLHDFVRDLARQLLYEHGEVMTRAAHHTRVYATLMRIANDEQRLHIVLPEIAELHEAFLWAVEHDLQLATSLVSNCAQLMWQFNLVREHWDWCQRLLRAAQQHGDPALIAAAWIRLSNTLFHLAALSDEDQRQRLNDALAACDEAMRFYSPNSAPLRYAGIQKTRGLILRELANLPGETRHQRLSDALNAYDGALNIYQEALRLPHLDETTRFEYAGTQSNRSAVLSDLAMLPSENRRQRLDAALEAVNAALDHYRPDSKPFDYASAQHNLGAVLAKLANSPGEDRRQRLYDALAACDEALRVRHPNTAPFDYAATQLNRSIILYRLANSVNEDRHARLQEALVAGWIAASFFERLQRALHYETARRALIDIRLAAGEAFDELWEALAVGPCPAWLQDAGEQPLIRSIWTFLDAQSLEDMRWIIEMNPQLTTEAVDPHFDTLMEQYKNDEQKSMLIARKRMLLQVCRGQDVGAVFEAQMLAQQAPPAELVEAVMNYQALRQTALNNQADVATWRQVVQAGEVLLGPKFANLDIDYDAVRVDVALDYNRLVLAQYNVDDMPGSLRSLERAIALHDDATFQCNKAGVLIDLKRLDDAAAAIERARVLRHDAAWLAQLEMELARAREDAREVGEV